MKYDNFLKLYQADQFREIDKQENSSKFYLLRSISKSKTLEKFCNQYHIEKDLNKILDNRDISEQDIIHFIKNNFNAKTPKQITEIESELNKMQNFDWGGSMGNSLEKNIVNHYIKKILKYEEIERAIASTIQQSVHGYTVNSWYNHWSSILIEEMFNNNEKVVPTIDLVEKIDFFIDGIPFDLKVTYFPDELMKKCIEEELKQEFGYKSELACTKKIAQKVNITIPQNLNDKSLLICLQKLLKESVDENVREFVSKIKEIKKKVIQYYQDNPKELIKWLYENQGERRFDAANRFYLVLIDSEDLSDSWKLKRNVNLLKNKINEKLESFSKNHLTKVDFTWKKESQKYSCISELLFIIK